MSVISEAGRPLGSSRIAEDLARRGIPLGGRMVRYYLEETDRMGFTENLGRSGRKLTELGRSELNAAVAVDRVGFISDFVDELAYRLSFDPATGQGTVILNLSTAPRSALKNIKAVAGEVLAARLGMGRLMAIATPEKKFAGRHDIPEHKVAIGTLCSVTLNGVLQSHGIPVTSRFGGLLEMRDREFVRFIQIINYDGTTIDPMEIFIKGRMTRVLGAARTGNGTIGASFREIPVAALTRAKEIIDQLDRLGMGGVLKIGDPGQRLLDVPVPRHRVGIIVAAGLNPVAAIEEAGIITESFAMDNLCDFGELGPVSEF